jgi:hypothetical protein
MPMRRMNIGMYLEWWFSVAAAEEEEVCGDDMTTAPFAVTHRY